MRALAQTHPHFLRPGKRRFEVAVGSPYGPKCDRKQSHVTVEFSGCLVRTDSQEEAQDIVRMAVEFMLPGGAHIGRAVEI